MKKYLLIVPGGLLLLALIAHLAWTYSGSGQPQLVIDDDGVQVYTIKVPGSALTQIRAVRRVDTTVDRAVAAMLDGSLENCVDWSALCIASTTIEPWDPAKQYYVQHWRKKFPSPFGPRDFVLKTQYSSDPQTGSSSIAFTAVPDKMPPDACCVRVTHMNSVWRITPVGPHQVEVVLTQDIDLGLPYPLFNQKAAVAIQAVFDNLPRLYNKAKYDGVTLGALLSTGTIEPASAATSKPSDAPSDSASPTT